MLSWNVVMATPCVLQEVMEYLDADLCVLTMTEAFNQLQVRKEQYTCKITAFLWFTVIYLQHLHIFTVYQSVFTVFSLVFIMFTPIFTIFTPVFTMSTTPVFTVFTIVFDDACSLLLYIFIASSLIPGYGLSRFEVR